MGLNPKQAPELIDSSMIQFNKESDKDTGSVAGWGGWAERANKYLSELKTGDKVCSVGNAATADEACKFDKAVLGVCKDTNAGFDLGKPCLFLKLNKIYGVENVHYNDPDDVPEGFPEELKDHIRNQAGNFFFSIFLFFCFSNVSNFRFFSNFAVPSI